ncbi:hypothetical protein NS331_13705 [Pseudacidovorax intermedius]|uniref:Uncharacterized protein n=1 Tax=Pseudacidovorax intermedius TaxID=433924 RepID=A0A147GSW1_9BURK|nr:hypothetical protein NS331_13705 [Pseudacidovorax intermedius]
MGAQALAGQGQQAAQAAVFRLAKAAILRRVAGQHLQLDAAVLGAAERHAAADALAAQPHLPQRDGLRVGLPGDGRPADLHGQAEQSVRQGRQRVGRRRR